MFEDLNLVCVLYGGRFLCHSFVWEGADYLGYHNPPPPPYTHSLSQCPVQLQSTPECLVENMANFAMFLR